MTKEEILEQCNAISKNTLVDTLGIRFTDLGDDFVSATMPVTPKVYQPDGILHGGASAALAETVGSVATFIFNKDLKATVRGIEITSNHLKSIKKGNVIATARPLHKGRTIQLWEVKMVDEEGTLISVSKLTAYIKKSS